MSQTQPPSRDSAGTRIRERRLSLGRAQSDVARAAGISPAYLNLIEHDRRNLTDAVRARLAEALETSVAYFYDGLAEALDESTPAAAPREVFSRKETLDLIQAYYQLDERPRRRLLDLAKSLNADEAPA